jgi:hypothetical protein
VWVLGMAGVGWPPALGGHTMMVLTVTCQKGTEKELFFRHPGHMIYRSGTDNHLSYIYPGVAAQRGEER